MAEGQANNIADNNIDERELQLIEDLIQKRRQCLQSYRKYQAAFASLQTVLADRLHWTQTHHFNSNIAKTTSASVGILGGVATVAGLFLAPFTFGTSVLVGGLTGATLASATTIGTQITEKVLESQSRTKIQEEGKNYTESKTQLYDSVQAFCNAARNLINSMDREHLAEIIRQLMGNIETHRTRFTTEDLRNLFAAFTLDGEMANIISLLSRTINASTNVGARIAAEAAATVGLNASARIAALAAVVGIALDSYTLGTAIHGLVTSQATELERRIEEMLNRLNEESEASKEMFEILFYVDDKVLPQDLADVLK